MNDDDQPTIRVDDLRPQRRSLRVAVVTETYPPEVNGVAATIARVVEGLCRRGHELQLVRPRQQAQGEVDDAGAVDADPAHRLSEVLMRGLPIPRYPQLTMGLPSRRALLGLWTRQRPDVVHLVTEGPLGGSALAAATQLKLPVVSDFRTNFHAYSRHYGMAWLHRPIMGYLRRFHNRSDCTMVPTESLRQELAAYGFQRLRVVARGVDTLLFDPACRSGELRRRWGAGDDTPVLLYVGRLAPEKNLDALVRTSVAMRAQRPGLKLVLVGDGPSRAALQLRLPQAVFAGLRHGADLAAHYASADLFLFPSLTETFGNVVPEAMASGLPVLAYDCAAAAQLVRTGETGWLAAPGDEAALQAHACRALADLDALRALGRRARAVAQRLGWERIVGLIEAEYDAAMRAERAGTAAAQPSQAWPVRP